MRLYRNILISMLVFSVVLVTICWAMEEEVGEIIEASPEKKFIQVNDRMFAVGRVLKIWERDKPRPGLPSDLYEGAMVKIKVAGKKGEFWKAETVTIYLDEMRDELLQQMDYSPVHSRRQSSRHEGAVKKSDSPIRFENGVYRN